MVNPKIKKTAFLSILLILVGYIAMVAYFEARLGYLQPAGGSSIAIATFNDKGERHERVVRLTKIDGNNYIAAQHWPRAWYYQALERPDIEVKMSNDFQAYTAVPLSGNELERVKHIYRMSLGFRFRTGFPPRKFMRLDRTF
jgi:hypothetical protein